MRAFHVLVPFLHFASIRSNEAVPAAHEKRRTTFESRSLTVDCDPDCPAKSDCVSGVCVCKSGYTGDGWRCHNIDECVGDPWPCPHEGGYCVNTDPDDEEYPMYKCGCNEDEGFEAWTHGAHGATMCIPTGTAPAYSHEPSTQPTSNLISNVQTSQGPSSSPSIVGNCSLCPPKSRCIQAVAGDADAHLSDDGTWVTCECKEGYLGDGWRCEPIDECTLDDPPCPSAEDGGFCEDRDPDDAEIPRYKCGCLDGYEMDSYDEHGATSCRMFSAPPSYSVSPSAASYAPSVTIVENSNPNTRCPPTDLPSNEFSNSVFLNVNGAFGSDLSSAAEIISERELLEFALSGTYLALDPNECNCRILLNVSVLGILGDFGFLSATDEFDSNTIVTRRLQEQEVNSTNSTASAVSFSFDFTIWIRFAFTCFLCETFLFVNDAFRRQLDNTDTCWTYFGFEEFQEEFSEQIAENGVVTILPVVSAENEPSQYSDFLPETQPPTPAPTEETPCETNCDGDHQICVVGQCLCEVRYFQPSGIGGACQCEDECENSALNDCHPKANCVEECPGYQCECKIGYEGDGRQCDDIDECVIDPDVCGSGMVCINLPGAYECVMQTPAPTKAPTRRSTTAPSSLAPLFKPLFKPLL